MGVRMVRASKTTTPNRVAYRNKTVFRNRLVCFLSFAIVLLFTSVVGTEAQISDLAELQLLVDAAVDAQMADFQIPNAAVAIVAGGETVLVRGYGTADRAQQLLVDGERSLFRIGSTAKLLTWTAVMQLVEQGKLDLNTDVNQYLDFRIPAATIFHSRPAAPLTLKHLMTHTPGFEGYLSNIFSLDPDAHRPLAQSIREDLPARVFPPGEVIAYSNYGASLAGYIVERVSGMPFAAYVEENIFEPLGMHRSTFRQPLPSALAEDLAKPYRFVDGEFRKAQFEYMSEPGGSMSSTAADMARFMLAHLLGGELDGQRVLQEDTVNTMHSQLFTHHPQLPGLAHGFIEGQFNGRRVLLHPGGTMLYDTALYLLPDEQVGFFITHSGGSAMANLKVFAQFMDAFFPEADSLAAPEPIPGAAERAGALVGEYHQNRRAFTTDDKIMSLMFGVVNVSAVDERLFVAYAGATHEFVEVEQGVFRNTSPAKSLDLSGDLRTIVFGTDPMGRSLLMMAGPVSYSRAPWYEQSMLNFGALAGSILFIVGSLLIWGIAGLRGLRRRDPDGTASARKARLARWVGVLFALLTVIVVLEFLMVGEPDPVYLLPTPAYTEIPAWSAVISAVVPRAMAVLGVLALMLTVTSWTGGYWGILLRIHYTLFTLAGLLLLGLFYQWNILTF